MYLNDFKRRWTNKQIMQAYADCLKQIVSKAFKSNFWQNYGQILLNLANNFVKKQTSYKMVKMAQKRHLAYTGI